MTEPSGQHPPDQPPRRSALATAQGKDQPRHAEAVDDHPNRSAQPTALSGVLISPPSASPLKMRRASSTLFVCNETLKPRIGVQESAGTSLPLSVLSRTSLPRT